MDNRPIGIFDSGVGGLTCVKPIQKRLPHENIIYFGDTARAPYGSKSPATVCDYSSQLTDFLIKHDAKMIVLACNTTSSVAIKKLRDDHPGIHIQGIIEPAAAYVAETCNSHNSIGILGTSVTVKSRAYENALFDVKKGLNVHSIACPAFVPLIEGGSAESETMDMTVHHYLDDFVAEYHVDTLVLGCTHYPIIEKAIKRACPGVKTINPAVALAEKVAQVLAEQNMLADENQEAKSVYYASDLSADFINMINFLGIDGDFSLKQHRF